MDSDTEPSSFVFEGGEVPPGETEHVWFPVSETYLGEPVTTPVTVINGARAGPTVFLTAAVHGDELNGVEVVREVAREWDHDGICGTLVCLPVVNTLGFVTQQRYLPVQERDLNRAFPGKAGSTGAKRIAHRLYENFLSQCDFGLDFHTSTRGRTNMFHVRADMSDDAVARLARAFGSNMILDTDGSEGMLRRELSEAGVPTITVEMGQAHRFERRLIDHALDGVESVFAEYEIYPTEDVRWPGWRTVISGWEDKTWLRADVGGLVEVHADRGALVAEGDRICTITNPFKTEKTVVEAPFGGVVVGVLENPVVSPGNPLCHLANVDDNVRRAIELHRSQPSPAGGDVPAAEE
ncbi:succinylglutamate desuccinylase/aspartoacylase family protein [Halobaculum sp. MBLA0147]|uniref:succinylglutamate desuccinylase/aspartoacylase family protein n=1 Tax=Halobaculum sp. MBLA0147 TaxID=3079934 RepID=UPI00352600BC